MLVGGTWRLPLATCGPNTSIAMLKADSKMRTIQRVVGAAFAIYCFLVVIGWWPLRRLETFLDPFRTDMFLPEKQFVPPEAYMTTVTLKTSIYFLLRSITSPPVLVKGETV